MKKIYKAFAVVIAILIMASSLVCTAFAAPVKVEDMKKSVVYLETIVEYTSPNFDISFQQGWTGTGFAVGNPGEPVQYVATCYHCIGEEDGVYGLLVSSDGEILDFQPQEEGTSYPEKGRSGNNTVLIDFFNVETVSLRAYFSRSSGDYVELTPIAYDVGCDVAVCKLASDPTDKIVARPLEKRENVEIAETVYAIGYPSTSKFFDGEGTMDYKDSTVTKGIVSNTILTYGTHGSKTQYYVHQIDADVTHGNSGGPLFDEDGNIIGINAFINWDEVSNKTHYSVTSDELIKLLDANSIPYKIAGSSDAGLYIGIAAAAVIVVAIIVVIVLVSNKKKNAPTVPAPAPVVPVQAAAPAMAATSAAPATPAAGKYYLIGVSGKFEGKKYSIDDRAVIGRNSEKCNVVFPADQPGVSSVHCEITRNNSVLTIKDCGSTYGTFIGNDTKLEPNLPVVLKSGERFYVGDKQNLFEVRY